METVNLNLPGMNTVPMCNFILPIMVEVSFLLQLDPANTGDSAYNLLQPSNIGLQPSTYGLNAYVQVDFTHGSLPEFVCSIKQFLGFPVKRLRPVGLP